MGGFTPSRFMNEAGLLYAELVSYNLAWPRRKKHYFKILTFKDGRSWKAWMGQMPIFIDSWLLLCYRWVLEQRERQGAKWNDGDTVVQHCQDSGGTVWCRSTWLGMPHFTEGSCDMIFHMKKYIIHTQFHVHLENSLHLLY